MAEDFNPFSGMSEEFERMTKAYTRDPNLPPPETVTRQQVLTIFAIQLFQLSACALKYGNAAKAAPHL